MSCIDISNDDWGSMSVDQSLVLSDSWLGLAMLTTCSARLHCLHVHWNGYFTFKCSAINVSRYVRIISEMLPTMFTCIRVLIFLSYKISYQCQLVSYGKLVPVLTIPKSTCMISLLTRSNKFL